jgi:mono/diheme cytochrome c family protein
VSRTRTIVATTVALGLIGGVGGLVVLYSGIYNVAADKPHTAVFQWAVGTLQKHSVSRRAPDRNAPPLNDANLIRHGFTLYQEQCVVCHGAPGVGREQVGWGINPSPPLLYVQSAQWTDAELFWIIEHGIKLAGMPAFGPTRGERDIWALVAFSRRLTDLSMEEYRAMTDAAEGLVPVESVDWVQSVDPGYRQMVREADAARGRRLLASYGCGSCHVIPGVRNARGGAGPPLTRWAERHFIAGRLINTPRNLVPWIMDPQQIEPGTTMPALGVSVSEALDMSRYLFQLGRMPNALHTVLETSASADAPPQP